MVNSQEKLSENNNTMNSDGKTTEEGKRAQKALGVMFLSLVIDLLGFTMILPLLPALLDHYGRQEEVGLFLSLIHFWFRKF